MKYRKKPVVVEAVEFTDDPLRLIELQSFMGCDPLRVSYNNPANAPTLWVETLEGGLWASKGDYIIKGVAGEFYPCKPEIFEQTYQLVE